ncbi:hypothetical protein BDR22DRAFT_826510 [Usnea florida]
MPFTSTSMLLVFLVALSTFTSAQRLNQNQTCANACTAAQACDFQCAPGTTYNLDTDTEIYIDCLCQNGCLCNAEICLQCCEAAGVNGADPNSCPFIQLWAGNVLAVCSAEGTTPAKATPAKDCFVYGNGENGNPTSTFASASPFPSSVESFIAGLLPLTNVTVDASSLIFGSAGAGSSPSITTGSDGSSSTLTQTSANVATTSGPLQASGGAAITSAPQPVGMTTTASSSSLVTSSPTSTTGQPSTSSQKGAAEGTWPTVTKGFVVLLALALGVLFL